MQYHELYEGTHRVTEASPRFAEEYDLLVAGLGSAGSFCALSAAREGLRVLGVERGCCAGGMSVQGVINGYYNGYPGGAFEVIDADVRKLCGEVYAPFANHPDAKKIRLEQELLSSGVRLSYRTVLLGVYAEGQSVRGARLLCEGRARDVSCRFLSDSTSEGHVLRMLGVSMRLGRETDGATQPFSSVRVFRTDRPDGALGRTNDDSGYINPYDDLDFSWRVIEANARHNERCNPEKERLLYLAPQIGVREGMLMVGEETLTLADILSERPREDTLVCAYSDIDRHGQDRAFDARLYQDWYVLNNLSTVTMKIRVPLGALVPKGWRNLVSVCRCLSMDNYAASAVRMNRDMYRLGEAAGIALALAVQAGADSVLKVDAARLREKVCARGCFDPRPDETKGFVDPLANPPYAPVHWLTDPQEIARQLNTDCPGVALWSCRLLGDRIRETLWQWTQQRERENLRLNASLALAALGDERCLPLLREMARNRSAYFFLDCRRSNQLRSVIAICYLGRFADEQSAEELLAILRPEEFDRPMYHCCLEPSYKLGVNGRLNQVYYQHVSFAVAALQQIALRHPALRPRIAVALLEAFADDAYVARMTTERPDDPYGIIVGSLKARAQAFAQS